MNPFYNNVKLNIKSNNNITRSRCKRWSGYSIRYFIRGLYGGSNACYLL